jgi:hypothetical protein
MKKGKKPLYFKRLTMWRKRYCAPPPNPFAHLSLWGSNPNQKFEFRHGQIVKVYP